MAVSRIDCTSQGPSLSRLVLGLWRLNDVAPALHQSLIETALSLGITSFDHADIYGDYTCEALFGDVLAAAPGLRGQMELITKCDIKLVSDSFPDRQINHYDTSKAHIIASVEQSLQRLRTDYLDVLLLHRPDPLLDADEVADAFTTLHAEGKVRAFGVSNFSPSQFDLLASRLSFPLVTNQVECSVLNFEVMHDGTLDHAQRHGYAPMAWSPLGGGRLFNGTDPQAIRVRHILSEIGDELEGAQADQVAYAWLLRHPARILPVLGTGKEERLRRAADATALDMSREQWYRVWRASKGHDVP